MGNADFMARKEKEAALIDLLQKKYNPDAKYITGQLLEWAADVAFYGDNGEEEAVQAVVDMLEHCVCNTGSSPAPVYTDAMRNELCSPDIFLDVQECLDEWRDSTGEVWADKEGQMVNALWFAYEWRASDLCSRIENDKGEIVEALGETEEA